MQLRFTGGGNPYRNRLKATFAALIDGDTRLIKTGRMALHDFNHQAMQLIAGIAQYFDG